MQYEENDVLIIRKLFDDVLLCLVRGFPHINILYFGEISEDKGAVYNLNLPI